MASHPRLGLSSRAGWSHSVVEFRRAKCDQPGPAEGSRCEPGVGWPASMAYPGWALCGFVGVAAWMSRACDQAAARRPRLAAERHRWIHVAGMEWVQYTAPGLPAAPPPGEHPRFDPRRGSRSALIIAAGAVPGEPAVARRFQAASSRAHARIGGAARRAHPGPATAPRAGETHVITFPERHVVSLALHPAPAAVTAATPFVLALILLSALAHDSQQSQAAPQPGSPPPDGRDEQVEVRHGQD